MKVGLIVRARAMVVSRELPGVLYSDYRNITQDKIAIAAECDSPCRLVGMTAGRCFNVIPRAAEARTAQRHQKAQSNHADAELLGVRVGGTAARHDMAELDHEQVEAIDANAQVACPDGCTTIPTLLGVAISVLSLGVSESPCISHGCAEAR